MVSISINNLRAVTFWGQPLFYQCSNIQFTLLNFRMTAPSYTAFHKKTRREPPLPVAAPHKSF
jgi:hypothetical protein